MNLGNISSDKNIYINSSMVKNPDQDNSLSQNTAIYRNHGTGQLSSAMQIIRSLSEGDTFSGTVVDSNGSVVTIALSNGDTFTGGLINKIALNIGDNITFRIKDNSGENILLKPVFSAEENPEFALINKSLSEAFLPKTERNMEMVDAMLKNSMSISKSSIQDMSKLVLTHNNYPVNDIVTLKKMDIPVNENTLKAYSEFCDPKEQLSAEIRLISGSIEESITDSASFTKLTDIIWGSENADSQISNDGQNNYDTQHKEASQISNNTNAESASDASKNTDSVIENISKELRNFITLSDTPGNSDIDKMFSKLSKTYSTSDILKALSATLKQADVSDGNIKERLSSIIKNRAVTKMLENELYNSLKLNASDADKKENIKLHLEKTYIKLNGLINYASETGNDSLLQASLNMKSNMDFLNNLNSFVSAVQIPLKNIGEQGEGELYVYKRNGSKTGDGDESLKAFLHLDMKNLGPLDIYVTLKGQKISTNFCVADDSILDFLEANIDLLNRKLNSLGYNSEITVTDKDAGFTFKKEILEPVLPVNDIKRYKLDLKV